MLTAAMFYLIGSLFMTINFQPMEGDGPKGYLMLVMFWPIITLWHAVLIILGFEEQEEEE